METFDLESHLKGAYSSFPEAKRQPLIGISANYEGIDATLRDRYYKQVIAAGGTPVIIPPVAAVRSSSIPWSIWMVSSSPVAATITRCGWAKSLRLVFTTSTRSVMRQN